jgi:hypothetical protein
MLGPDMSSEPISRGSAGWLSSKTSMPAGRPLAGRCHRVGDDQQVVPERERVRPHAPVRQGGQGQQDRPGRRALPFNHLLERYTNH